MGKQDTTFERHILDTDPAVKRFRVIKALLWKNGFRAGRHHDEKCICLTCVEGGIKQAIKEAQ